jgi:hypothetical protein
MQNKLGLSCAKLRLSCVIEAELASKDFNSSSCEVVFHGGRLHNFHNFENCFGLNFPAFSDIFQ